jgi:hypothetical protein
MELLLSRGWVTQSDLSCQHGSVMAVDLVRPGRLPVLSRLATQYSVVSTGGDRQRSWLANQVWRASLPAMSSTLRTFAEIKRSGAALIKVEGRHHVLGASLGRLSFEGQRNPDNTETS